MPSGMLFPKSCSSSQIHLVNEKITEPSKHELLPFWRVEQAFSPTLEAWGRDGVSPRPTCRAVELKRKLGAPHPALSCDC